MLNKNFCQLIVQRRNTMKNNLILAVLFSCFFFPLILIAQTSNSKNVSNEKELLAQKLVNQCANIKEGDLVLITGGVKDTELLEDLAINVRRIGAFPLISLGSDRLTYRYYNDVPLQFASKTNELDYKIFDLITALIAVNYNEDTDLLSGFSAEKIATLNKANEPVNQLLFSKNIKFVELGNGLNESAKRAKMFGIKQSELAKLFWDGINVDYNKLKEKCELVKSILSGSNELHITNPNGTDLKFKINNRPIFFSDGVISDADIKIGMPACQVYLPAGEVYLTPVPGTAEGKIVVDHFIYLGKEIKGLTLIIHDGQLTSMLAQTGLEPLKNLYDSYGPEKNNFAYIDIGTNPNVKIPKGSKMGTYMSAGMVTVGVGNDAWAGGNNNISFALPCFLPGSTLYADGKLIVENGVLK